MEAVRCRHLGLPAVVAADATPLAPPVPAPIPDDGDDIADWRAIDDLGDLDALPQRERLIRVMEKAGWVQAKAARLLGLTPRQIGYALRKYSIEIKRL